MSGSGGGKPGSTNSIFDVKGYPVSKGELRQGEITMNRENELQLEIIDLRNRLLKEIENGTEMLVVCAKQIKELKEVIEQMIVQLEASKSDTDQGLYMRREHAIDLGLEVLNKTK